MTHALDLRAKWLGLSLPSPLVVGASPVADDVEAVVALEKHGAGAVVLQSLFEEQLTADQWSTHVHMDGVSDTHGEALSYFPEPVDFGLSPDRYLRHIERLKAAVDIPIIASLNGVTNGGWVKYARRIAEAGADAIELNVYYVASDLAESPTEVEDRYLDILRAVRAEVTLPLAMKLSPFFSSLGHFAKRLSEAGADGLVMFNRFYQPDIDIDALEVEPSLHLSDSSSLLLRLRWLAALHGRFNLELAASGGVHTHLDAIKALMAGAHTVQMASALLRNGVHHMRVVHDAMVEWLVEQEYESISQMVGNMSLGRCPDPAAYERANYTRIIRSWHV